MDGVAGASHLKVERGSGLRPTSPASDLFPFHMHAPPTAPIEHACMQVVFELQYRAARGSGSGGGSGGSGGGAVEQGWQTKVQACLASFVVEDLAPGTQYTFRWATCLRLVGEGASGNRYFVHACTPLPYNGPPNLRMCSWH